MNPREKLDRFKQLLTAPGSGSVDGLSPRELAQRDEERREMLREMAAGGIPDSPSSLRPLGYHLLLALPPTDTLLNQYSQFVQDISDRLNNLPPPTAGSTPELKEDRLLREIERDVGRTFGGLAWFSTPTADAACREGQEKDAFWTRLRLLEEMDAGVSEQMRRAGSKDGLEVTTTNGDENATAPSSSSTQHPTKPTLPHLSISAANSLSLPAPPSASISLTPPTPTTPSTPRAFAPAPAIDAPGPRPHTRREALLRPLVVYGVLNPALGYVQGMNSLVGVLYRVFSDLPGRSQLEAEACAFFALGAIISQIRDLFVSSLDGTITPPSASSSPRPSSPIKNGFAPTGLGATLARFSTLLLWLDPELARCLERKDVNPAFFLVRWLTTLFANEFELPDLVRVWDRIISLYPSPSSPPSDEALSPVLGHLLDLSLALVLLRRSTLISPFANPLLTLQDLQVSGEAVDRLLASAWDIRERRLGRAPAGGHHRSSSSIASATSSPAKAGTWRDKVNRLSAQAQAQVAAAQKSPAAKGWGAKWWSGAGAAQGSSNGADLPAHASEFDLDETASVASSSAVSNGRSSVGGFGFGHGRPGSISMSHPPGSPSKASRGAVSDDLTIVDGKRIPPPPARIDERETLEALVEEQLPRTPAYDSDSESGDDGPGLADRAKTGWAGLKDRLAASDAAAALSMRATNLQIQAQLRAEELAKSRERMTDSDAAAQLAKATTNAAIKAQMMRDQLAEQGTGFDKLRQNAVAAAGRLRASTGAELGGSPARPGSPVIEPFTPPGLGGLGRSPSISGFPESPSNTGMARQGSSGPKPLLLSGSARRASNVSADGREGLSSSLSRRSSINRSPTLVRSPPPRGTDSVSPLGWSRVDSASPSAGHAPRTSSLTSPPQRVGYHGGHGRTLSGASEGIVSPQFASRPSQVLQHDEHDVHPSPVVRSGSSELSQSRSRSREPLSPIMQEPSPIPPRGFEPSDAFSERAAAPPSPPPFQPRPALVSPPVLPEPVPAPAANGRRAASPVEMGFAIPMSESTDQPRYEEPQYDQDEQEEDQPARVASPVQQVQRELTKVTLVDSPMSPVSSSTAPTSARPLSDSSSSFTGGIRAVTPEDRFSVPSSRAAAARAESPSAHSTSSAPSRHSSRSSTHHPPAAGEPSVHPDDQVISLNGAEDQPLSRDSSLTGGGAQGIQRSKIVRRPGVGAGGRRQKSVASVASLEGTSGRRERFSGSVTGNVLDDA